jgi:probable rRNA maturation factor
MKKGVAIVVQIADQQTAVPVDKALVRHAVHTVLFGASVRKAKLSIAIVDDATIARLNRQYLNHEGPADVLSFPLTAPGGTFEGEVVVGAEVARREAPQYGWTAHDELLLYVVHGLLHLVGYDDKSPGPRAKMRRREQEVLAEVGVVGNGQPVASGGKPAAGSRRQAARSRQQAAGERKGKID